MPLINASLTATLAWTLSRTNAGFQATGEGPDSLSFSLVGLNLTTFNQLYAAQFTLAGSGGSQTIDLTNLTNLVNETFAFGHALAIIITTTGGPVTLSPGATNGLTWFFGGTSPSHTIPAGGCFLHSEPAQGPGVAITSTAKTLTLTNNGTTTATVSIAVLGGP